MHATTHTPRFSVKPIAYVIATSRRQLWSIVWIMAAIFLSCIIAGFSHSRYWYLGLTLAFVIYPMIHSLAWMIIGMKKSMVWLLRPQEWISGPDGIEVIFFGYAEDSSEVYRINLKSEQLGEIEQHHNHWLIETPTHPLKIDFLLIPTELLPVGSLPSTEL